MFTLIEDHPLTDKLGWYWDYHFIAEMGEPEPCPKSERCVLHLGDHVRVLSVWDRGDGTILLYVYSFVTGEATHIVDHQFVEWTHGTLQPRLEHGAH